MKMTFNFDLIRPLQQQLNNHPIYGALHTLDDLRCFMEHHIYSVWDFMSIVKYLQHKVAPTTYPWLPHSNANANVQHFINSLVLEEESDHDLPDEQGNERFCSHFSLYCKAMYEVGANPRTILKFIDLVRIQGIEAGLNADFVPMPARLFVQTTFGFLHSEKPHTVAAALAIGREHVIPNMFREFLAKMHITPIQAPIFHYYLNRHIHLDEDFHAPLSIRLLHELCEQDENKLAEAEQAACQALEARITFWDGVLAAMRH